MAKLAAGALLILFAPISIYCHVDRYLAVLWLSRQVIPTYLMPLMTYLGGRAGGTIVSMLCSNIR